ncbi:MAG: hypothetical protein ACI86M_001240 [Saprospiraceae bacterium]|jgi:hypothetical protein
MTKLKTSLDEIHVLKFKIYEHLQFENGIDLAIHNLLLNYESLLKLLESINLESINLEPDSLKGELGKLKYLMTNGRYVEAFNIIDNGCRKIDFDEII